MADTTDLDLAEFAENPEPRCPCVLLLDTSGSMQGDPIKALNQGLQAFKDDLSRDPLASRRVELAVVTFDSHVKVVQDFVTADQFQPPRLSARGDAHGQRDSQGAADNSSPQGSVQRQRDHVLPPLGVHDHRRRASGASPRMWSNRPRAGSTTTKPRSAWPSSRWAS